MWVHSSENQTDQDSEGALRTPLPWALGMQYLRTETVPLPELGIPAMAMHVSTFLGFFEGCCCCFSSWEDSPPQMGLGKCVCIYAGYALQAGQNKKT